MAQALVAEHGGEVPASMDALVKLPGVGRKTANVVLGHALGVPGLPVDRHVLRVANRIGIAESDSPEIVEQQLCAALPPERWTPASDTLILHGRRICRPKPLCEQCAVQDDCDYFAAIGRDAGGDIVARARPAAPKARPHASGHLARRRRGLSGSESTGVRAARAGRARHHPARFRRAMKNLAIVVEDEPAAGLLAEMEIEPPDTLLGLYQGIPLTERHWDYGNALPDRILLFQGPLERESDDEDDLVVAIGETLDPRGRPLLRVERRRNRSDRGPLLARGR